MLSDFIKMICENIIIICAVYQMTEKEMADALEIPLKTLKRIEAFDPPKNLSLKIVFKIYEYFKIPPQEFCTPMKYTIISLYENN